MTAGLYLHTAQPHWGLLVPVPSKIMIQAVWHAQSAAPLLMAVYEALNDLHELKAPGSHSLITAADLLQRFPWLTPAEALHRLLPWNILPPGTLGTAAAALLADLGLDSSRPPGWSRHSPTSLETQCYAPRSLDGCCG